MGKFDVLKIFKVRTPLWGGVQFLQSIIFNHVNFVNVSRFWKVGGVQPKATLYFCYPISLYLDNSNGLRGTKNYFFSALQ